MSLIKIQKYLFYLIVFLIPCNLAKHWIQDWSYVSGILVDYLIPTLYVTDILVLALLGLWAIEIIKVKSEKLKVKNNNGIAKFISRSRARRLKSAIPLILLITVYSLLFTKNPSAALYKLLKITEFGLLIYWIKAYINIKQDIRNIVLVLAGSVIWQSCLGILQWLKQGSVFGYWFFGEQPYNTSTLGIKLISWFGELKVPAYGTFPHPNILAGFLCLSLFLIIFSLVNSQSLTFLGNGRYTKMITIINRLICYGAIILGTIALFLTFSLISWLVFLASSSFILIKTLSNTIGIPYQRRLKSAIPIFQRPVKGGAIPILFLITVYSLLFTHFYKTIDPISWQRRIQLNKIALKMWLSSPILGVGLNNFIPRMEEFGQVSATYRFLQPVHNIYLLILAETGAIGLIGLISLIWLISRNLVKNKNYLLLIAVYCLLFTGLFDHYFLTIQQGMLISSLVLGLGLSKRRNKR